MENHRIIELRRFLFECNVKMKLHFQSQKTPGMTQTMKKYCILLLLADLCCMGILLFQSFHRQSQKAGWEGLQTEETSNSINIQAGSSQDEVYIKEDDEKPKIAITFDDGPNPQWTPKLLEGLKERGVKASFFVIGEKAEKHSEIIKKMYEEGHVIGNHTYSHVQLTALSPNEACEEISKTSQILYEITGEYTQFVRPPFGSWDENLECDVALFPVMWNIDTLDWTTNDTTGIVNKAVKQAKNNGIILLHDNYESSVDAALQIIDRLQAQGYEFVTVEELLLE